MSSTHGLNVFYVAGHIFSSPNSRTIPPIPLADSIGTLNDLHPRQAVVTHWADPCFPGLPFIPLSPRFDSEPFSCLSPPRDVFPIEGCGWSWRLAPATVKSFQALEHDLCLVEKALRTASEATLMLPSWWRLFPLPHKYGYNAEHSTAEGAQTLVLKSRDAFLPLMGWCSFLISHFHEQVPQPENHIFRWERILIQSKFSLDYVQVIKVSELTDFSANYPRVGVFLDHNNTNFQHYVTQYIKCNVPVWIHWGPVALGRPIHNGVLKRYLPADSDVAAVRKASKLSQTATQRMMDVDAQVVNPSVAANVSPAPEPSGYQRRGEQSSIPENEAPAPKPGSHQRRGEQWCEFFARMDRRRATVIEQENPRMKQARLAKENAQAAHPPPGLSSKAPRVFEWEEDVKTGFLVRNPITRSYAQDIWQTYSKSQRRYDATLHEWDLCSALDPQTISVVGCDFIHDSDSESESDIQPPTKCGELPSSFLQVGPDHVSSATSYESISHPPAILLPSSAVQNVETVSFDSPPRFVLSPTLSANRDGIPTSKPDGTSSSSILYPQTNSTDRDHILSATICEVAPGPVSRAILPPTSAAETDAKMSSSIPSSPLAAIPAPPNLGPKVSTCELPSVSSTIPLPTSAVEGDVNVPSISSSPHAELPSTIPFPASATEADVNMPAITSSPQAELSSVSSTILLPTSAVEGDVDMPAILSSPQTELPSVSSTILLPTSAIEDDVDMPAIPLSPQAELPSVSPTMPLPDMLSIASSPHTVIAAPPDLVPSKVPTCELAPVPSTVALPTSGAGNEGARVSARSIQGQTVGTEDVTGVSAEPGGMHAIIYNGLPSPLFSWSVKGTLSDKIHERYGFSAPGNANTYESTMTWSQVRKTFGDLHSHVERSLKGPISHFLEGLLSSPTSLLGQPAALWDLDINSVTPLIDHYNCRFRLIVRHPGTSDSDTIYFIEPQNRTSNDVNWQLALQDAATVLECFRQEDATSIRDLALFLLQHGTPFSTRIQRSQIRPRLPLASTPLLVLGWRPTGHKPTVCEYNFYENHRRAFFDHPRSRAARLKGGILWRLALEGGGGLVDEHVLDGPSDEVLAFGTRLAPCNSRESLWDDNLTEADMDLICGVYKVDTDTPNQVSDLSWWPKQSTFLKSGLWPGYWSRSCEEWFQHRHDSIASGKGDLKTATQWSKSLTLYQNIAKLRRVISQAAELYIMNHGNFLQ